MASTTVPNESSRANTFEVDDFGIVGDNIRANPLCVGLPVDDEAILRDRPCVSKDEGIESEQVLSVDTNECGSPIDIVENDDHVPIRPSDLPSTSSQLATNPLRNYMHALEARVQELEGKLATLSMILQLQQRRPSGSPGRLSPPRSPIPFEEQSSTENSIIMSASTTPSDFLESLSPHRLPSKGGHVRNLSFRVLHSEECVSSHVADRSLLAKLGDEVDDVLTPHALDQLTKNLPTRENSKIFLPETLPERSQNSRSPAFNVSSLPLPRTIITGTTSHDEDRSSHDNQSTWTPGTLDLSNGNIDKVSNDNISATKSSEPVPSTCLEKNKTSFPTQIKKRCNIIMPTTSPFTSQYRFASPSNATSMKLKWLDYLNSVQESNYDTDKQMEEFVKVPGAVEALLNFGFWICMDSFLYTLTILPIRFVWSCLLLSRITFFRLFQTAPGSDGPFRFHRR
jgi:hypothetical protein